MIFPIMPAVMTVAVVTGMTIAASRDSDGSERHCGGKSDSFDTHGYLRLLNAHPTPADVQCSAYSRAGTSAFRPVASTTS